jgi:hypothetical protein
VQKITFSFKLTIRKNTHETAKSGKPCIFEIIVGFSILWEKERNGVRLAGSLLV